MSTGEHASRSALTARSDDPPLVGRDAELAAVLAALREGRSVVVAGAAGVGKTRLAREAVGRIAPEGGVGLATGSQAAAEVPLGALAPLWSVERGPATDVASLQAAVDAVLAHRVVMIDDAHCLDPVSAAVIAQVAVRRETPLVLTARTDTRPPDAITTLWKNGDAERVELSTLTADDTTTLVETILDGPVEPATRRRLFTITGGNALWLRHLLDGESSAGRLARTDGLWCWDGRPVLSAALEELLAARIGALSEAERHVLELLALGEPLGLSMLERLADADAIEETAQRALITVDTDGARWEARLGHPLYGEAVRATMSAPRLRRLRGELAVALGATGQRRAGDRLRQAVLGLGGDHSHDPDLLAAAAAQALGLGDVALGERLFRAACERGGGFDARVGLAHVLAWTHRGEEAEVELAGATADARTPAERARAVQTHAVTLYFMLARPDEARALLDREDASGHVSSGSGLSGLGLSGLRATFHLAAGELDDAEPLARHVLASPTSSPSERTFAGWAQTALRALGGTGPDLTSVADRAAEAAGGSMDTAAFGYNIRFLETIGYCLEGRIPVAQAAASRMHAQQGDAPAVFAAFFDARIALDTGRARSATTLLVSLRPTFPGVGGGFAAWIELMVAAASSMAGRVDEAEDAVERAESARHPGMAVLEPQMLWAQAWVRAARGATGEALVTLTRAANLAATSRQHAVEVLVRHTAVCFGDRAQAAALTSLVQVVDSPRARAAAAHAKAWSDRDPAALDAASAALEALELLLSAADAAAQASVLHLAGGEITRAAASSERATSLAGRCEHPRTPALIAATSPVSVSAREREVAALAATGLSNREIADRMHVSLRTVESHIYRACNRLGLSGRTAFVAAVVPDSEMQ